MSAHVALLFLRVTAVTASLIAVARRRGAAQGAFSKVQPGGDLRLNKVQFCYASRH